MNSFSSHIKKSTSLRLLSILLFLTLFGAYAYTSAIGSPYQPGITLNPSCAPGDINCFVQIIPSQTGNSGKFLSTDGTTTVWTSAVSGGSFANATFTNAPTFATLTGVVKANGASPATAMNGTSNYVTRWTDANTIGIGVLYDNATNVGVGTATPAALFSVGAASPFQVTNLGAVSALSLSLGGGTALNTTNQTGTGSIVMSTAPALVTPNIGAATASSLTVSSGGDIVLPGGNFGISNLSTRFLAVATGTNPALTFTSSAASFSGSVSGGAASFTTGNFSGLITSTITSGNILNASSATTASLYTYMANTSGTLFTGVESSTAGAIFPGTTAYASVIGNTGNKPLQFATQNAVRMTIDGSGNVGVGLSTVHSQITVGGSAAQTTAALTDAGTRAGLIEVLGAGGTAGNGGGIVLGVDTIGAGAGYGQTAIKSLLTSGAGNGTADLAFATRNATTDTALTERMRITASGNVGIGTATPGNKLEVAGNISTKGIDDARIYSYSTDNTGAFAGFTGQSVGASGGFHLISPVTGATSHVPTAGNYDTYLSTRNAGNSLLFAVGNVEKMRINGTTGNVGIGTTSPAATLDITGTLNTSNKATIQTLTVGLGGATSVATNTAFGYQTLNSASLTAGAEVAVGYQAGSALTTGGSNALFGYGAGKALTTGSGNTAIGTSALIAGTAASDNVFIGNSVAYNATTANQNVAIGEIAMQTLAGGAFNTAVGQEAMTAMGGGITYNTAMGYRAGRGAAGIANTALGTQALYTGGDGTGHNIAVGYAALYNTTSNYNIGIGDGAGLSITTGSGNVVLGAYSAASFPTVTNSMFLADGVGNLRMRVDSSGNVGIGTASPNSIGVGYTSLDTSGSTGGGVEMSVSGVLKGQVYGNASGITYQATTGLAHFFYIGATQVAAINSSGNFGIQTLAAGTATTLCYNTTAIGGLNTISTCSSDQRLKQNITPLGDDIVSKLMQLNPVSFNWDPSFSNDPTLQYGVIAQQVATVFPNLVSKTAPTPLTPDGTYSVNFNGLYAPIIKSIQEMNITVTNLSSLDTSKATSLGSLVKQFLGDTANTLGTIYADTFNARQKICVDGECLTRDDVHALLQLAHPVSIPAPSIPTPPVVTPAPTPTPTIPSATTPTTSATLPASTSVTSVTSTTTAITTTPTSTPSAPVVSTTPPASPTPAPTPTASTTPPSAATTQPQSAPTSAPTAPSTATTPPPAPTPTPAPTPARVTP